MIDHAIFAAFGGAIVFAVMRVIAAAATVDAVAKRQLELANECRKLDQRATASEGIAFEQDRVLDRLCQATNVKRST
jgi:hypothetical protein